VSRFEIRREVFEQILGKVTLKRFATLRVPMKLCRGHVVNALAVYGRVYGHTDVTSFTQTQVHRCVTHTLRGWGTSVINGALPDQVREVVGATAINENDYRWAEAQVARFWPKTQEDL
jgi:hypothetical protein